MRQGSGAQRAQRTEVCALALCELAGLDHVVALLVVAPDVRPPGLVPLPDVGPCSPRLGVVGDVDDAQPWRVILRLRQATSAADAAFANGRKRAQEVEQQEEVGRLKCIMTYPVNKMRSD